jgi:D-arabinose 1-dehydrogenase-like Zn-dependent alcohol dehydrogenase
MYTTEMTEKACKFIEEKGIKPAVGRVFGWSEEEVKSAFTELSKGSVVGKLVIKVGGEE